MLHIVVSVLVLVTAVSCCRSNMTSPGSRQSPININTGEVRPLLGLLENIHPLKIDYRYSDNSTVRVYKDNYTVKLVPETISDLFMLSGGPLRADKYNFNELHFHWGDDNSEGSEHTVNRRRFSMEAHFVFHNARYGSPERAMTQPDGFTVIGIFIEAGGNTNPSFQNITNIVNRSSASDVPFFVTAAEAYNWFLQTFQPTSKYYTYLGSLTTPPFSENVRWIVFAFQVRISSQQIEPFRQLTFQDRPLTPNFRELQPLNDRTVYYSRLYRLSQTPQ